MFGGHKNETVSIEQLISQLEHIEQGEISSDIRANVHAELKRIKRNVSAILAFTAYSAALDSTESLELRNAITNLRRECLKINATVSRVLLLQTLRVEKWVDYSSSLSEQYMAMVEAARQFCVLAAPLRAQELASAF